MYIDLSQATNTTETKTIYEVRRYYILLVVCDYICELLFVVNFPLFIVGLFEVFEGK